MKTLYRTLILALFVQAAYPGSWGPPAYEDLWKASDVVCIVTIEYDEISSDQSNLPQHWKYNYERRSLMLLPRGDLKGEIPKKYLSETSEPEIELWLDVIQSKEIKDAVRPEGAPLEMFGLPHAVKPPPNENGQYILFLKYRAYGGLEPTHPIYFLHWIDQVY